MLGSYIRYFGFSVMLFFPFLLLAQAVPILLNNASFEDTPGHSKPPWGWFFCGPQLASPPDVHPSGMYGVEEQAKDGRTYVGMVIRDVNTWETIGQKLEKPLLAGECYTFSIWLALPQQYLSVSRRTGLPVDYSEPAILRIWGGEVHCEKVELLASSNPVYHPDWKEYRFMLIPQANYSVITLEAHYDPRQIDPYCGSLLLDNASALLPVDCETGDYDFEVEMLPVIPQNWEEVEAYIQENSKKVKFKPGNRALEEQFYRLEDGQIIRGNIYLHSIVMSLFQFPEAAMVIKIPFYNAVQYKKCREYLADQLYLWHISDAQWKIKKRKVKGMHDKQLQVELIYKE